MTRHSMALELTLSKQKNRAGLALGKRDQRGVIAAKKSSAQVERDLFRDAFDSLPQRIGQVLSFDLYQLFVFF
jgi:hypothetical protein